MFNIIFRTPGRIAGCSEEQGQKRTNPIWHHQTFGYLKQQLNSYSDSKNLQQAVTKAMPAISQDEFRK
ncbi:unnamed protein product, partial [Rotaria socialis]